MTDTKKHYNEHRAGKKSFQVMLTPAESDLLDVVKKLRRIAGNRALLVELLTEEKERLLRQ